MKLYVTLLAYDDDIFYREVSPLLDLEGMSLKSSKRVTFNVPCL